MTSPHPVLVGSHIAIDFLNTAYAPDDEQIETIGDGRAFLDWMVRAGLLEEAEAIRLRSRLGGKALDSAAAEARKMRRWARSWLERWRKAPGDDYRDEIAALNKLLAIEGRRREVAATADGFRIIERPHIENEEGLLSLVAWHIATLITQEEASLVKHCAGPGCTLWFLDRTKAHRRLFCSAAACGNRAKVAAFRKRQRGPRKARTKRASINT